MNLFWFIAHLQMTGQLSKSEKVIKDQEASIIQS